MTIQKAGKNTSLDIDVIHDNTSQELISITDDKLRLILIDHLAKVDTSKAWQAPLGLVITIILVFCTAEFKAFGLSADTWQAAFFLSGIACLIWLIVCLVRIRNSRTIDDVMAVIKNKV